MHYVNGDDTIQIKAEKFVSKYYQEKLPEWAVYHNLQHTTDTVNACLEIGKGSNVNGDDLEILCIAAWFHDTGYIFKAEGHEEKSVEIAVNFLKENKYPSSKLEKVRECIMATKITNVPQNFMEFIIRDSDLISLGRDDYFRMNNLLKLEMEMRENKKISEFAWLRRSIHFLSSHIFLTEYAKLNFYPQLKKNLITLQKQIRDI
jgi:predicted metal-dependent HD superfamily phosphohydrolase